MNNKAQYWQARTPLRVRVLGLFFVTLVLLLSGRLWSHWGHSIWFYSGVAAFLLVLAINTLWRCPRHTNIYTLCFDTFSGFSLLNNSSDELIPIHITRVWQSLFSITLQVHIAHNNEKQQLTFWRNTLSVSCWRELHIYLWRYQLQYQFADLKDKVAR